MSSLNKKLLISGCGLSYGGQERKTWVKIFKVLGVKLHDVGGPAVSNQWILNKTFAELLQNDCYDKVILQLTAIGKLDVEVDDERFVELVKNDSIRNFTFRGIWPSSASIEHDSKKLWYKWLYSPALEVEDLFCKLIMLKSYCDQKNVQLFVFQGYPILWTETQKNYLQDLIVDIDDWLYQAYPDSEHYQFHDHTNSVPSLSYQIVLARRIARSCGIEIENKLDKLLDKLTNIVI